MYKPSLKEDHISQIPGLQKLVNLCNVYLILIDTNSQRGVKLRKYY